MFISKAPNVELTCALIENVNERFFTNFWILNKILAIADFLFHTQKEDFVERSKILAGYRQVILLNYENNYVERSS